MRKHAFGFICLLLLFGLVTPIFGGLASANKPDPEHTDGFQRESCNVIVDGIDVSNWQGTVDWAQVYSAGYRFAFCKASEGTTYTDPYFVSNQQNGNARGLLMGAYHFARPDYGNDAGDEARYFVGVAGAYIKTGFLRPALDLETGGSLGKTALTAWVHKFMDTVKYETGVTPIIYASSYYANNYLESSATVYDLWIAHWTYDPTMTPNTGIWSTWAFWQWSNLSSVPGIIGKVDSDAFNGDLVALQSFVIHPGAAVAGHTLPATMTAGTQATVSLTYHNSGNTVWVGEGNATPYRLCAGSVSLGDPHDNEFTWLNFASGGYSTDKLDQRVFIGNSVSPGDDFVFTFDITAPASPGDYWFDARMVREGSELFGDCLSFGVHVQVPVPETVSPAFMIVIAAVAATGAAAYAASKR
jgi:lysozyme